MLFRDISRVYSTFRSDVSSTASQDLDTCLYKHNHSFMKGEWIIIISHVTFKEKQYIHHNITSKHYYIIYYLKEFPIKDKGPHFTLQLIS